jgi:glutamine synthetase
LATLPVSLGEALAELETDDLIRDTLGDHIFERFIEAKSIEWQQYCLQVSHWELERYLPIY